ncbi:hypothetical protein QP246_11670, partial [Aerococcus urinae]
NSETGIKYARVSPGHGVAVCLGPVGTGNVGDRPGEGDRELELRALDNAGVRRVPRQGHAVAAAVVLDGYERRTRVS